MQTQEKFSQVFPKNFKLCFWYLVLLRLIIIYFEKLFKEAQSIGSVTVYWIILTIDKFTFKLKKTWK